MNNNMKSQFIVLIFVLTLLLFANVIAQEPKSIHQIEWEQHRHLAKQPAAFENLETEIIPLQPRDTATPSVTVFGYLPDWEYLHAPQYLQYDLLTHIAAFDFHVSSNGDISYPSYWPWTNIINEAHANGVKVILTAVNFEGDEIHTIMTDPDVKENFIHNCADIIDTYQLDGVNIDFESLNTADRGNVVNNFMAELTQAIKDDYSDAEVSFAGPAVNWGGWQLEGLALACDYIFIMGYAFAGGWSSTSGANSPLTGGSYNITNTVNVQYGAVTSTYPERLILGVPYYGNKWKTNDGNAHSSIIDHVESTRYYNAMSQGENYGFLWDSGSQTPWYRYQSSGDWYQVWFDDAASLELKYDLADSKNYRGVGMWALGYDGAEPGLWDLLNSRYGPSDVPNLISQKPRKFELNQNYPNPFNSNTKISYSAGAIRELPVHIDLSIYNLIGQKVVTLVNKKQSAGNYQIEWDAADFTSGIYILRLIARGCGQSFIQTKKMVLSK